MSQYYYNYKTIDVLCPRDPGFKRAVSVRYHLPYTGGDLSKCQKTYVIASCKLNGKTETCIRCLDTVVNMLNSDDTSLQGSPLSPDLQKR